MNAEIHPKTIREYEVNDGWVRVRVTLRNQAGFVRKHDFYEPHTGDVEAAKAKLNEIVDRHFEAAA